jgi:TatD DNase family protein
MDFSSKLPPFGYPVGYIDAHCHLSDERVRNQARAMIERARAAGVESVMLGGTHEAEWGSQTELKRAFPDFIKTSFGIHPWWVERLSLEELNAQFLILKGRVHAADAIGETGLDFHVKRNPQKFELQRQAFRMHLALAKGLNKPLVLHIVGAHPEALALVHEMSPGVPVLVHSFSGNAEEARDWCRLGAMLSFSGGILRRPVSKKSISALKATPRANLLFETDSPDQSWREDKLNEPALVPEIYREASVILGCPLEELQQIVAENFGKIR